MRPVTVIILHGEPGPTAGPLERLLADARATQAQAHRVAFTAIGARDVSVVGGGRDDVPFGRRLAELASSASGGGIVVLGSGAVALASARDLDAFIATAGGGDRVALANNRFSADIVAIARADELPAIPDLPSDNALPRWLDERAGWTVRDLRDRWRLQVDLDSPIDLLLIGRGEGSMFETASDRVAGVRRGLADPRAEVLVAGRTSAGSLAWLERHAAARIRALVEERGLRASSPLAQDEDPLGWSAAGGLSGPRDARPPRSVLGFLLEREGPEALGSIVGQLADAAIVDSRVLLANRLGVDERSWPSAEDRFASDLLAPACIANPWLRALTASARDASVPILLGGHTLVGPGVRLIARIGVRSHRLGG